jgi:hypothetical protein
VGDFCLQPQQGFLSLKFCASAGCAVCNIFLLANKYARHIRFPLLYHFLVTPISENSEESCNRSYELTMLVYSLLSLQNKQK